MKACKLENEVPYDANATRTWVERYVLTKDGAFHADSPEGGRDGYITPELDLNESGHLAIDPETIDKAYFVPKLCNQCDNPPCVQVCPVGATYKTPDGVVLVDRKWCIGCGYCIMACPYGARFFHPELPHGGEMHVLLSPHQRRAAFGVRAGVPVRRAADRQPARTRTTP